MSQAHCFCMHMFDTILKRTALIWVSLDLCHVVESSVLLLLACAVAKALGFAVPAFWSWKSSGFLKGMCLFLACCRMCLAGDDDFGQEHCTKMFSTLWAVPASNSAAVSSRCYLLQRCPLPILSSLPKENAYW